MHPHRHVLDCRLPFSLHSDLSDKLSINMQAGKMMGASSEGTIVTAVYPARCPEGPGQGSLKRGLPKVSLLLMDMPQQHQHQQQMMHQRSAEKADKRQKTEGSRPEALAVKTVVSGQQHTPKDARLPRTPPCIKIEPLSQQRQETQPIQADERIAQVVTGRVGKLGMDVIRDTMMRQQALFTEQVWAYMNSNKCHMLSYCNLGLSCGGTTSFCN